MVDTSTKKLFSAERQMLRAKGIVDKVAPEAQAPEVLSAIAELRRDVQDLQALIRAGGGGVHQQPEPVAVAAQEPPHSEINHLKTEIRALSLAIQHTKSEIAALRPKDSADDRLIAVTSELDAIVTSTERATDTILEAAEKIDGLAQQLQSQADDGFTSHVVADMRDIVVGIFEACNFQDITGQRISKVVRTLQFIEERVNRMIDIWGPETFEDLPTPPEVEPDEEQRLLNGPQLENQGVSQADIDKLFG